MNDYTQIARQPYGLDVNVNWFRKCLLEHINGSQRRVWVRNKYAYVGNVIPEKKWYAGWTVRETWGILPYDMLPKKDKNEALVD